MTGFRWTLIILAAGLLAVHLWLVGIDVFYDTGEYTTDSVFYIDTARNLAQGDGYVTRIIPLHEAIAKDLTPPQPMTTWPPLYPMAIATLSIFGIDAPTAALLVPIFALALCLLFAFLLVRQVYGPSAGILAAAALLALSPVRIIASHAWSESLGIAFALAVLWLLLPARRSRRASLFFAAGLATGVAFATRYSLAPVILVGLAACWQGRSKRTLTAGAAYAIGAAIPAAPIILRNILLTGGLGGPGSWHDLPGLTQHLRLTGITFQRAFTETPTPVAIIFAVMAVAAIVQLVRPRSRKQVEQPASDLPFFALTSGFALLYVVFLISSAMRYVLEPLSERLLAPVFVMIMLITVGLWVRATRWRGGAAALFAVLIAGTLAAGEYYKLRPVLAIRPPAVSDVDKIIQRSETLSWLHENLPDNALVITVDGYEAPLYLGPVDTAVLYTFLPPDMRPDYNALVAYADGPARNYEDVYMHVPEAPLFSPVDWPHDSPFINALRDGGFDRYPRLDRVFQSERDTIFRIKKASENSSGVSS